MLIIGALVYAIAYFAFKSSHVPNPTSLAGAAQVVQSAKTNFAGLKETLDHSGDVVDAATKFLKKLTELVSKVPAFLTAAAAAYAGGQKLLTKSK
jgi:hypothetical protein